MYFFNFKHFYEVFINNKLNKLIIYLFSLYWFLLFNRKGWILLLIFSVSLNFSLSHISCGLKFAYRISIKNKVCHNYTIKFAVKAIFKKHRRLSFALLNIHKIRISQNFWILLNFSFKKGYISYSMIPKHIKNTSKKYSRSDINTKYS